jgi:hypothetical protein
MAFRWELESAVDGKMAEYLEYVSGLYKGKKSVVVGLNNIRRRYKQCTGMGMAVARRMEELELAEVFSESVHNKSYQLDLKKIRRYLNDSKGKE